MQWFQRLKLSVRVISLLACLIATIQAFAEGESPVKAVITLNNRDVLIEFTENYLKSKSGELMVGVKLDSVSGGYLTSTVIVGADNLPDLSSLTGVQSVRKILFTNSWAILLSSPLSALDATMSLSKHKSIRFVHPDFVFPVEARGDPREEPYFSQQWNLSNTGQLSGKIGADIGVTSAWSVTTGSPSTILAVLDLGFDQDHKDLIDAWYINDREIPGNKKDDDGNGLIDDVRGWNFSTNSAKLIYGAAPQHGTATAGITGARANSVGIVGVCPECRILPIVVSGRVSEDAAAIGYAKSMGAMVMSNSWGYVLETPRTDVVIEALTDAGINGRHGLGIPIVFAMHNANVDDCRETNPDISSHPEVIAVSSVDHNDIKVVESAHGACLKFLAPSSGSTQNGIASTDRTGTLGYNTDGTNNFPDVDFHRGFWGTSAAAPQVAGMFALLLSHEPGLTKWEAIERMRQSAVKINPDIAKYDPVTGHSSKYGYGRVHGGKLFQAE